MRPRLLRPDNLTPPTRTPWGGQYILAQLKRGVPLGDKADYPVVGESWEVSVEPSFPSRCADGDDQLDAVIAGAPIGWLGAAGARQHGGQTPLLTKLLDAADNLSVQVHPRADDPELAADESGKPEGWYVLAAAPGAGLYLGFRDGVDRAEVARCIAAGGALDQLLHFVPIAPGDAFVLPAGTVHAIGAGATLFEPQLVAPGRRALTYRFWDWNRRYDQHGRISPDGRPRPLHIDRSLAVTDWHGPRAHELVAACRCQTRELERGPFARAVVIDWPHFTVERWAGRGQIAVDGQDAMWALTCLAGAADVQTEAGSVELTRGYSAVVPARAGAFTIASRPHPSDGDVEVEILATRA